jgi:hypothetical protein
MKTFLLVISLMIGCAFVYADDTKKETVDLLAHKTIEDFHKAIEIYNQKKEPKEPAIKRAGKLNYNLVVNKIVVRFTILNYLNDQMYVSDQLVQKSTFGFKKTTNSPMFISNAIAADAEVLNAATAKMILIALSKFNERLEEVGMMCFSGCQKNTREENLKKIINTLDSQSKSCNEQLYAREDSIKKYPSFRMVSLLHSTFNPEFQSVRNFYLKVTERNKKSVDEFMSKKLAITKNYENCINVMAAGTVVDGNIDTLSKEMVAIKTASPSGAEIESSRNVCIKMDELKNCLVNLKKNVSEINSNKRNAKKTME